MDLFKSYYAVIAISLIVIVSYFFNVIAKRTNIPSVLMLIALGIGISQAMIAFDLQEVDLFPVLEVLGIVGLIMIVLEGALDLELSKQKTGLIVRSLLVAVAGIAGCSAVFAFVLNYFIIEDFYTALVYALPLAVMSSAIIIPSVANLATREREFMLYESALSDVIGIIAFSILVEAGGQTAGAIAVEEGGMFLLSIALAFVLSIGLVWLFEKISTNVKLFLLIAVLLLLYSVGKLFHLSSLIIILVFGLVLNNHHVFFRGPLRKLIDRDKVHQVYDSFHLMTRETAFVVRTFFFVIFGMSIILTSLLDQEVALISIILVCSVYLLRLLILKVFVWKGYRQMLFLAPRGLITILLFFSIPEQYQIEAFDSGIVLYVILITSMIMSFSLMTTRKREEPTQAKSAEGPVGSPETIDDGRSDD